MEIVLIVFIVAVVAFFIWIATKKNKNTKVGGGGKTTRVG
jgi:hypothetical protein